MFDPGKSIELLMQEMEIGAKKMKNSKNLEEKIKYSVLIKNITASFRNITGAIQDYLDSDFDEFEDYDNELFDEE